MDGVKLCGFQRNLLLNETVWFWQFAYQEWRIYNRKKKEWWDNSTNIFLAGSCSRGSSPQTRAEWGVYPKMLVKSCDGQFDQKVNLRFLRVLNSSTQPQKRVEQNKSSQRYFFPYAMKVWLFMHSNRNYCCVEIVHNYLFYSLRSLQYKWNQKWHICRYRKMRCSCC